MKKIFYPLLFVLAACTNIDCPLDNVVVMTSGLYDAEDESSLSLQQELTVYSANGEHILLNKAQDISSFVLPLRHGIGTDTLLFFFSNLDNQEAIDTLFLSYTDNPHFESVDCPAALFHTLTNVGWTSHPLAELPLTIDSVAIVRSNVNYDDVENLKIYLRSTVE